MDGETDLIAVGGDAAQVKESSQHSAFRTGSAESFPKKLKKVSGPSSNGQHRQQSSKEDETIQHEAGLAPPPYADDGFNPNILLQPATGNVIIKTRGQKSATKLHAAESARNSMLRVYTDGSSLRNGQEGAFAGVGIYFGPSDERSVLGSRSCSIERTNDFRNISEPLAGNRQTNQRAELTAILRAIEVVPRDRDLTIVTDSQYAINCCTTWYQAWLRNGWKTSSGKAVENRDIIENIQGRISERENMGAKTHFEWIKGHANLPGNVEADRLAVNAAREAAQASL